MTESPHRSLLDVRDFGAVDADADELLRQCFQDHEAYLSVRDMRKFLVLGRKGSGKTAIYRRLTGQERSDTFSLGHNFEDYPWNHHDLQAQVGVPTERRYTHSWRYLMLIGLARILLNQDNSQPWNEDAFVAMQALESFIVDSYGSKNPDLGHLFTPDSKLHFKGGIDFKILRLETERLPIEQLPVHIQEVNAVMQRHVLRALNPECRYFVCFDQLDLGFSKVEAAYQDRLVGLLIAAKDLFNAARDVGKQLNPVVFLRDDIYQDLQFEDKNKITENYSAEVLWTDEGDGLSLKALMESRFQETMSPDGDAIPWSDVFDEEKQMSGRQTKYKHICDRTFLRPRDMIRLCNQVLKEYQKDATSDKFQNNDIINSRKAYSDYLLSELDDEIAKHVPKYKDYLQVLRSIGSEKFSYTDFGELWETQGSDEDAFEVLEQLFEFSIIGYLKPGGSGGGSGYVWRYKNQRARFDRQSDSYRVHPGFKEALDLTR